MKKKANVNIFNLPVLSDEELTKRCMALNPGKGLPYCSLLKGHISNHEAHSRHDLSAPINGCWPQVEQTK